MNVMISGNSSPSDGLLFTALKPSLGGHKLKDSREVGTLIARRLVIYGRGNGKAPRTVRVINGGTVARTTWKSGDMAIQING
jgi:hypothetical protein